MFGLHKWSLISFSRMNKVASTACTISRESCFLCWGQRFGSDFFASINFRPPLADYWYSLSYLYLSVLGTLVTMVSGLLLSIITGESLCSQLCFLTRKIKSSCCVRLRDVSRCHFVNFCFQVVASRKNAALICL